MTTLFVEEGKQLKKLLNNGLGKKNFAHMNIKVDLASSQEKCTSQTIIRRKKENHQ